MDYGEKILFLCFFSKIKLIHVKFVGSNRAPSLVGSYSSIPHAVPFLISASQLPIASKHVALRRQLHLNSCMLRSLPHATPYAAASLACCSCNCLRHRLLPCLSPRREEGRARERERERERERWCFAFVLKTYTTLLGARSGLRMVWLGAVFISL